MNELVICWDLDGTLCQISPEYFVYIKTHPKNWDAFHCHIPYDKPVLQVKFLYDLIQNHANVRNIITTARQEKYREDSEAWLKKENFNYTEMFMRDDYDTRPDFIVKQEMLELITAKYGKPFMAFDDRNQVLDMWQVNGVFTMDVSQGQGDF